MPLYDLPSVYSAYPEFLPESERDYERYCQTEYDHFLPSTGQLAWFWKDVISRTTMTQMAGSRLSGNIDPAAAATTIRPPAFGMTKSQLDRLEVDVKKEVEASSDTHNNRYIFDRMKKMMLENFTSTDGATQPIDLVHILRREYETGRPAPVPGWWKEPHQSRPLFESQTRSMRGEESGYMSCENVGCPKTETLTVRFSKCGSCKQAAYCSRECQVNDWNARHKKCCKIVKKGLDDMEEFQRGNDELMARAASMGLNF